MTQDPNIIGEGAESIEELEPTYRGFANLGF